MSWRTVVISKGSKLDYRMGYLVVRSSEVQRIHLSEIHTLIVETTAVSLTAALLAELVKSKIKVIFCDEHRNPSSELVPYFGSHNTSQKVRGQVLWSRELKDEMWRLIIRDKIFQQAVHLEENGKEKEAAMLQEYCKNVQPGDRTNREGHAAKVYFNGLFGMDFKRTADCNLNSALDYGYSIILSLFNREVVAAGYITQLGLFHDNMFNSFNLSSDIMEPFRILVDRKVKSMDLEQFGRDEKLQLVDILNATVVINGRSETVANAAKIYCKSILTAMDTGSFDTIAFYKI